MNNVILNQAKEFKPTSVDEGNAMTNKIIEEQHRIHKQLRLTSNNAEWQKLNDIHYELRQQRIRIQSDLAKIIRSTI